MRGHKLKPERTSPQSISILNIASGLLSSNCEGYFSLYLIKCDQNIHIPHFCKIDRNTTKVPSRKTWST